jgi:hypothetical protein
MTGLEVNGVATGIGIRNVGAVDPTLKTSPVIEELAEEEPDAPEYEPIPGAMCFFNSESFKPGELVRSGTMVLECRDGLWIEAGPGDPDNP